MLRVFRGFYGCNPRDFIRIATLILRETPEYHYQWPAESINFIIFGDSIRQSGEISAAIELDPLCAALLYQDLNSLSQVLAMRPKHDSLRGQYKPTESLYELLVRWPEGLKYMVETVPGFFSSEDLKAVFHLAAEYSAYRCQAWDPYSNICKNCNCSEVIKLLLEHGCPLTRGDVRHNLDYPGIASARFRYEVLKHLGLWRRRLYELFSPMYSQDKPTSHQQNLLDHEAPYLIKKLQEVDLDPYAIFCLEADDYRLGSSLHSSGGTIYHVLRHSADAEMAFDMGFRDVDKMSNGVTPLSRIAENFYAAQCYYRWLIDHGADYTSELIWNSEDPITRPRTVDPPKYRIVHWVFRSFRRSEPLDLKTLDLWITSMARNPWISHFNKSIYYDGCLVSPNFFLFWLFHLL